MAEMGDGFGSECHLLRYLGRHRGALNAAITAITSAENIRWLDFHFDTTHTWQDGEHKGLDFLPNDHPALKAWSSFWPQTGSPPNWDAIGIANFNGIDEWILVEAKAHIGEILSSCQASEKGGLPRIRAAMNATKADLGISTEHDWLKMYYQYANRFAVLNFLRKNGVPSRLLFIYFTGDQRSDVAICPADPEAWECELKNQNGALGLGRTSIERFVHKLFLPVVPAHKDRCTPIS